MREESRSGTVVAVRADDQDLAEPENAAAEAETRSAGENTNGPRSVLVTRTIDP